MFFCWASLNRCAFTVQKMMKEKASQDAKDTQGTSNNDNKKVDKVSRAKEELKAAAMKYNTLQKQLEDACKLVQDKKNQLLKVHTKE